MAKVYTEDLKTEKQELKSPPKSVVENILAFSKSYEVLKTNPAERKSAYKKNVELILN